MDGDDDGEGDASPMAEEQPHPEPVLDEAAETTSSSTEPCPYGDSSHMMEFYRVLMLMHSRRFPAHHRRPLQHSHGGYVTVMVGVVRDGILTWYVNGEPVADDDAYMNGGFGGVAVSEEAIAALPVTTVQEEEEIMGEKECAVCLGAYEIGDTLRTMPCSHGFLEHCLFPWLRVSRLCPLCRFALPVAESFTDDDDDSEQDDDDGDGDGDGGEDDDDGGDGDEDDDVEHNDT